MKMLPRKYFIATLFLVALNALGFSILFSDILQTKEEDACISTSQKLECYLRKTYVISREKGARAALNYIENTVSKNTDYTVAHMAMHIAGYAAYTETHDVQKALAYAPAIAFSDGSFFFDGYRHGIFQNFFQENKEVKTPRELAEKACPDSEAASITERENCIHGIGHAFMYANDNDVPKSLSNCDEVPYEKEKYWCHYGVFMENTYLYHPLYNSNASKEYVTLPTMETLCEKINIQYRPVCLLFVGRALLIREPGNFDGAFSQCMEIEEPYRASCISQFARIHIASFFKNDYHSMLATCQKGGALYEMSCIRAVSYALERGIGGYDGKNRKQTFCDLMGSPLMRQDCMQTTKENTYY